ncbi:MAG TPA: LysM peptidoglycan-binding domain-containing protein [Gemmatimonadaceae bacterium]
MRSALAPVVVLATLGASAVCPRAIAAQRPPSTAPTPSEHTVKRGDTLWDLAKTYLGDSFQWPEIYRLNTDQIQDPHWIYPGEVLKLPGATPTVAAVEPPPAAATVTTVTTPAPTPAPMAAPALRPVAPASPAPTAVAVAARDTTPDLDGAPSVVRTGEYAAAPWVDQKGGPARSGYIMQAADIPGIASADQSRMNLYQRVLLSPPAGDPAPDRQLYLAYRLGPLIEAFGQIVIPTGVLEVITPTHAGEAATARVVKQFGEVLQGQRIMPFDTSPSIVHGAVVSVANGRTGKIRWILSEPVLPSTQDYFVVDIPRGDANPGDQIELYKPRQPATEGRDLAIPELHIAWAQVIRVTPYGATAIITTQEEPKIEEGTAARVAAKIP